MDQKSLNIKSIVTKILISAVLLMGLFALIAFAKCFAERIFYPYGLSYGEPICANPIINMARNPWIYDDPQTMPYVIVGYPPLFFYIVYIANIFWGSVFTAGRFVNFTALIMTLVTIYFLLRKNGAKTLLALSASLFLLMIPAHREIGLKMTIDSSAFFFSTLSLFAFYLHEKNRDKAMRSSLAWLIGGVACSVLAIFTKQTFVMVMAAFTLYLLFNRRFKDFLIVICTASVLLGTLVLIFQIGSEGRFLDQTVSRLAGGPIYLELIPRFWVRYLTMNFVLLFLSAVSAPFFFRQGIRKFFVLYFLITLLSTVTVCKIGSHMNYFLELSLSTIILSALAVQDILNNKEARKFLPAVYALALIQCVYLTGISLDNFKTPLKSIQKDLDAISEWIQKTPGLILSEDMGLLVANNRPIVYQPFEFNQLVRAGLWDENKLLKLLKKREFKLIILQHNIIKFPESQRFSLAFTKHILRFYRLVSTKHGYFVIIPKEG